MEDSIWRWVYVEFRDYINSITNKSITIEHALNTLREVKWLPKEYRNGKTVEDIAFKNKEILDLFKALRNASQPESLNLGFKIKDRERQLIDNLVSYTGGKIDISKAYARVIPEHSPKDVKAVVDDNSRSFYYWLEVAIAARSDNPDFNNAGKIEIIGSINGTPSIDGGGSYFQNGDYYWYNKGENMIHATGLKSMLNECGFSTSGYYSQRRMSSVIYLNLVTPCPEWGGSAGKSNIDLRLYQDLIAKTVSSLAYKIPSLHGKGIHTTFDTGLGGIYRPFLVKFLKERKRAIDVNPSLATADRLTQSGVWYRVRPEMLRKGFKPRNILKHDKDGKPVYDWNTTRNGFTKSINEVIAEIWQDGKVTRESLGITAKTRAFLYFNGQVYPVSFDSIEELARIGTTDMIIVEKEGVTDVLLESAKKYRIALVATAGKFVDYAKDLMKLAHKVGINVCVLTDFDIDGINMWRQANEKMGIKIKRIGITQETVTWLQENGFKNKDGMDLDIKNVEEEYSPNPVHFRGEDDPYLLTKRIELDSIIQEVGADAFWKYIVHQLEKEFPGARDYREIVPEPEPTDYYPDELNQIIEYLKDYTEYSYSAEWETIKEEELKEVNELLHVENKMEDIKKVLKPVVVDHEGIKEIVTKIKELMESGALPKIPDDYKENKRDSNNNSRQSTSSQSPKQPPGQPPTQSSINDEISKTDNNTTNESLADKVHKFVEQMPDVPDDNSDHNSDQSSQPDNSTTAAPSDGPDPKEIMDLMGDLINDLTGQRIFRPRSRKQRA
jgi:hypothetical protein